MKSRKPVTGKKQVTRRSLVVIGPAAIAQVRGGTDTPPASPSFSPERTQIDPNG